MMTVSLILWSSIVCLSVIRCETHPQPNQQHRFPNQWDPGRRRLPNLPKMKREEEQYRVFNTRDYLQEVPNLYDFVLSIPRDTSAINTDSVNFEATTANSFLDFMMTKSQKPLLRNQQKISNNMNNLDFIQQWDNRNIFSLLQPNIADKNYIKTSKDKIQSDLPSIELLLNDILTSNASKLPKKGVPNKLNLNDTYSDILRRYTKKIKLTSPTIETTLQTLGIEVIQAVTDFLTNLATLSTNNPLISSLFFIAFVALVWKIIPAHVGGHKYYRRRYRSLDPPLIISIDNIVNILNLIERIESSLKS